MAALTLAACATDPEKDPVQIKLNDLDARMARIERVMANQSLLDLANEMEALRSDVRSMHNDVDLLNNGIDANRKQQKDLYADLDQRLKAWSRGAPRRAGGGALRRGGRAARAPPRRGGRRAGAGRFRQGQLSGGICAVAGQPI